MSVLQKRPRISVLRVARVLAVVSIAMAAGHLAQTLAAKDKEVSGGLATHPLDIVHLSASGAETRIQAASLFTLSKEIETVAGTITAPATEAEIQLALQPAAPSCPIDLYLLARPQAMIELTLSAPCHAGERVVLRHAGLAITARLGADGSLATALPALVSAAQVEVMFANTGKATGAIDVPGALAIRRFGVQWQGGEVFTVHGLENGADFGQAGDVSPVNLARQGGGSLVVLGDNSVELPLMAQVYTFPPVDVYSSEVVVEAQVTDANCGQDVLAETIASSANGVEITDLTLTMPTCLGIGDFLVLKNLVPETKIAAN